MMFTKKLISFQIAYACLLITAAFASVPDEYDYLNDVPVNRCIIALSVQCGQYDLNYRTYEVHKSFNDLMVVPNMLVKPDVLTTTTLNTKINGYLGYQLTKFLEGGIEMGVELPTITESAIKTKGSPNAIAITRHNNVTADDLYDINRVGYKISGVITALFANSTSLIPYCKVKLSHESISCNMIIADNAKYDIIQHYAAPSSTFDTVNQRYDASFMPIKSMMMFNEKGESILLDNYNANTIAKYLMQQHNVRGLGYGVELGVLYATNDVFEIGAGVCFESGVTAKTQYIQYSFTLAEANPSMIEWGLDVKLPQFEFSKNNVSIKLSSRVKF